MPRIDLLERVLNNLAERMHADRITPTRRDFLVASLMQHAPTLCAMQDVLAQSPAGDLVDAEVLPRFGRPELQIHARPGSLLAWRAVLRAMSFAEQGPGRRGLAFDGPFRLHLQDAACEEACA